MAIRTTVWILPWLLAAAPAVAEELNISGFIGLETRISTQSPQFDGQESEAEGSLLFNPEFRYRTANRHHQFSFIPFLRADSRDAERTHFDIREAYWLYRGGEWEILTGFNKVFWGVAESRHLVDIINQTDLVEDIDQEDKLGQPMINVIAVRDWGTVGIFVLPGFRERTFPGKQGRLRTPISVETDDVEYESGVKDRHVDFALRYSNYFGDWDVGAYYFYGTGREPRLLPNADSTRLVPQYEIIHQSGIDIQYTKEAWLWKFEGIAREGQGDAFAALVGGFEYTFYQIKETAADLGVLFEYLYDGRDNRAPPTAFDNDIFTGLRLALNDVQDTQILAGLVWDPDTSESFYNLEAERRFGNRISAELRVRVFSGANPNDLLFGFERDDYIQLRVSWFF